MNELVVLKNNNIFTDSLVIAKGTDNEHESIVKTLMNYREKIKSIGNLDFSDFKSGKMGQNTMNELTIINKNGILFIDSREVAKVTEIRHSDLLRKIKKYETVLLNAKLRSVDYFQESKYNDNSGKENRYYLVTKKGCDMVANKMTGDKGIIFTAKYIDRFYEMEQLLLEKQTQLWQDTRIESKINRLMETDEIKRLIEYAKEQGSKNADKYYILFSKLANKAVGLDSGQRDNATAGQLNNLVLIENIINNVIKDGIANAISYKKIYQDCKNRINSFLSVAYLEAV